MKIKKFTLLLLLCALLSSCSNNDTPPSIGTDEFILDTAEKEQFSTEPNLETPEDNIYINGNVQETIEAGEEYTDPGITCPSSHTVVVEGSVNTSWLGNQKITYYVYSQSGELLKELHRYVAVVDTVAPSFTVINHEITDYYIGHDYHLSDFISDYSDNFNSKSSITVSQEHFSFSNVGSQELIIEFYDASGNKNTYTKTINVKLDFEDLIYAAYKNSPYKVSESNISSGKYIAVDIDRDSSLGYFESGSIHYLKYVQTQLGKKANVQISAKYGEFHRASINYHITGNDGNYSYGVAIIDATKTEANISSFQFTNNSLNLNEAEMLNELNAVISSVLKDFHNYMNHTINIEVK